MFCPNCGTNVADGAAFCPSCGTAFSAPQAPAAPVAPVAPQAPIAPNYYAAPPVAPQPEKKKGKGKMIAIILVVILAIGGIIGGLFAAGVFKSEEERIAELAEETAKKIERGTISGNTYTNESIGITFEKPSDWIFASDDEIAKMMGESFDATDLDDAEKALVEATVVIDMVAASGSNSVVVGMQNIEKFKAEAENETEYLEKNKAEFEASGYDCGEIGNITLCGKNYKCLEISSEDYNQKLYVRIDGDIAIIIVVTAYYYSDIAEIEAMFS